MDKIKFESPDMTAQNIARIAALFPNCIAEMLAENYSTPVKKVYKRAVNFELLKQMLSPDVVDSDETYELAWVGSSDRGSQQADPQNTASMRGRKQRLGHYRKTLH